MPWIAAGLLGLLGVTVVKDMITTTGDEAQRAAEITIPQLVTAGAAVLGLYLTYKAMKRR